jgi:hypothetical protein
MKIKKLGNIELKDELEEEKQNLEWHRTFNNQNLQFMSVYAMVTLPWLAGFVLLVGIIFWLLIKQLGV